jgi:hypothetical protein
VTRGDRAGMVDVITMEWGSNEGLRNENNLFLERKHKESKRRPVMSYTHGVPQKKCLMTGKAGLLKSQFDWYEVEVKGFTDLKT